MRQKSAYLAVKQFHNYQTFLCPLRAKHFAQHRDTHQQDLVISIPEGFSPNQDGVHDYFVIIRPSNFTIDLKIFNRWGNYVYTNSNYKNEWNGIGTDNFLGQELPEGGYYYTVKATDDKGKIQIFNGFVLLQR